MNKKIVALVAVLLLACTSVFAVGIGVQAGMVGGERTSSENAAITFKLDSSPYLFALHVGGLGGGNTKLGLTADNWIANKTFAKPFAYFYGWGLAASFGEDNGALVGARLLGGVNVFLVKQFELYAQIAWQPSIAIGSDGITPKLSMFPVNLGFRVWL